MKDKTDESKSLNNDRGITLIPVISKLFENMLLTEDLQFGFKNGFSVVCFRGLALSTSDIALSINH